MTADSNVGRRAVARITRRLIPFSFLLYLVAYIDRANVGFAAARMKADLGFSDSVYGLGAGIFFLGYFLFEIPSNLLLARVGARLWLARIAITWGAIASCMMLASSAHVFYALRFVLGVAESGFFPGVIFYLTLWFPAAERARAIGLFMTAGALSWVVGGPLSSALLHLDGVGGLRGWQWLFAVEGVPSMILGVLTLFVLTDRPENARWLPDAEKAWLVERLAAEQASSGRPESKTLRRALAHPRVWLLAAIYLANVLAGMGMSLWLPQIIKGWSGLSDGWVGIVTAIPYVVGVVGMVTVGRHSDRTRERRRHVIVPDLIAALGLALSAFLHHPVLAVAAISVTAFGMWGALPPFWAMSSGLLSGIAAAGAIALINSIGSLGGFFGPYFVGVLNDATGSNAAGLLFLSATFVIGAVLTSRVPRSQTGAQSP